MELHLESFALRAADRRRRQDHRAAGGEERQPGRGPLRRCDRDDACRPDAAAAGAAEPHEQRQQVHRKGHRHHRRSPGTGERPRLDHALGRRHRHRHDAGADGQAVPGVLPGVLDHGEQVRRHGPWPRDQPALLSDDGRRHHGGERAGQGLDLHDPPAARSSGPMQPMPRAPDAARRARVRRRGRAGAARSWSWTTMRPCASWWRGIWNARGLRGGDRAAAARKGFGWRASCGRRR